jgi:hypothetical protein
VFWSSVGGTPYPISLRVLDFERLFPPLDPTYDKPAAETYARKLSDQFEQTLVDAGVLLVGAGDENGTTGTSGSPAQPDGGDPRVVPAGIDVIAVFERRAVAALEADNEMMTRLKADRGVAWGSLRAYFIEHLPDSLENRDRVAYNLVAPALNEILGPQDTSWHAYRNESGVTYVCPGPKATE